MLLYAYQLRGILTMTKHTDRTEIKTILNHFNLEANDAVADLYLEALDAMHSDDDPDFNIDSAVKQGLDRDALERYIERQGDNAE